MGLGPPQPGSLLGGAQDELAAAALALEDWALAPEADEQLWKRAVAAAETALRAMAAGER